MTIITERDAKIAELCLKGRENWTDEDWYFIKTLKAKKRECCKNGRKNL